MDIKTARIQAGMSQCELAAVTGVSRISIVRYESGERVPDINTAARIAAALHCKVDDLIKEGESA